MKRRRTFRILMLAATLATGVGWVATLLPDRSVGQAFAQTVVKDVPYVPTPQEVVDEMLKVAAVTKEDTVYDLGCGDGRIVITAAQKYGARGVGVDIDPQRIKES